MNGLSPYALTRSKMQVFLDELESAANGETCTLYLAKDATTSEIENAVAVLPATPDVRETLAKITKHSSTGAAVFWVHSRKVLVLPPFPVKKSTFLRKLDAGPLLSLIQNDYLIGLVLVRLGSYAVGVCRGESLVTGKVGTGLVHGRHKKGGSSAHRFERHRDKQIEYFLTRVCQRAREHLEPHLKSLDYLVYGGARTTILLLQKQCPFIGKLETETLPPLYDIPEPRQTVLEKAVERVFSSTVYEWRGED